MMNHNPANICASVMLALMSPLALAQSGQSEPESLLVTGTYSPQEQLTSSSTVLDEGTIRKLNKRTMAGLLRTVPGLLVEEQGGPGGLTAVSIRGGEANFTLVLLDGVPVNDPTNARGGNFDFGNLDPSTVERVEVVRGAQSAIYGSDALSGVINIITRRASEEHRQQVRAELGQDDYSSLSLAGSGTAGELQYVFDLAKRDEGEPVPGSTRETSTANVRVTWQPAPAHTLSAGMRYLDGERSSFPEQSGGPEYAVLRDLDYSDYRDKTYSLGWTADLMDNWRSTLTATRFEHDDSYVSPGIFPFSAVPANGADSVFTRDQYQWLNTLSMGASTKLNLGADYRDEDGESEGYLDFGFFEAPTDFALDRGAMGFFAGISTHFSDALVVQASLRYDDPDEFDSETSAQLGASYALTNGLSFSANWGESYKLPSFAALGHALVGNPDLQPETATSWDVGLRYVSVGIELGATWFAADYEDLIDFDAEAFRNVNRNEVESRGVELDFAWAVTGSLRISGQATYTDLEVVGEDSTLTGRPEWTIGAVALWQIADNWNTALDYHWSDEQFAGTVLTGETVYHTLDDYHRVDWVLRWQPLQAVQVEVSVDNLFDEDYELQYGFPAPGRGARMSFTFFN